MALQPFFNSNNKREESYPRPGVSPNAAAAAGQAPVAAPAVQTPVAAPVTKEGESKLTVGPNIKLKGVEITDCDTLVVEGSVEATMDSRVIQISERGAFKGSAEIDVAEIRGLFDGNLTARTGVVQAPLRWLSPVRDQATERALIDGLVRHFWNRVDARG